MEDGEHNDASPFMDSMTSMESLLNTHKKYVGDIPFDVIREFMKVVASSVDELERNRPSQIAPVAEQRDFGYRAAALAGSATVLNYLLQLEEK